MLMFSCVLRQTLNQQTHSKELARNILMTLSWVKNRGVIKMSFINFVLTPRAAVLLDFTGGDTGAGGEMEKDISCQS